MYFCVQSVRQVYLCTHPPIYRGCTLYTTRCTIQCTPSNNLYININLIDMDISIIPTIQRSKKPAKPRYIKPDIVKRLEADYYEWKYRNSTIPPQCRVKPHFRDDTANGLAKCIETWARMNNAFYQRQNSQGQYDSRLGRWRKSGTTTGIADVQVTHEGRVYNFEIKIGRDRQSDVQKAVETRIKKAGGHYAVIKCYDDFLKEIIHNGKDRSYQPAG